MVVFNMNSTILQVYVHCMRPWEFMFMGMGNSKVTKYGNSIYSDDSVQ
jgi:hypothetical protein